MQSDHNNQRLANTIVAQITSKLLRLGEPTRLLIDPATPEGQPSGLHAASVIACENLVTVHHALIVRIIGRLPDPVIQKVDDCLRAALNL